MNLELESVTWVPMQTFLPILIFKMIAVVTRVLQGENADVILRFSWEAGTHSSELLKLV